MNSDFVLECFIENTLDIALLLVNEKTRKVVLCNSLAKEIMGGVNGKTIDDLINDVEGVVNKAELTFCRYVEGLCINEESKPLIAIERFRNSWFITIRIKVSYHETKCILTLLSKITNIEFMNNYVSKL